MHTKVSDQDMQKEGLWDAVDVATYLKTSRSWVYQHVARNELPHLRVGGLLRFDPEAIRAFARGQMPSKARVIPFTLKRTK